MVPLTLTTICPLRWALSEAKFVEPYLLKKHIGGRFQISAKCLRSLWTWTQPQMFRNVEKSCVWKHQRIEWSQFKTTWNHFQQLSCLVFRTHFPPHSPPLKKKKKEKDENLWARNLNIKPKVISWESVFLKFDICLKDAVHYLMAAYEGTWTLS